MRLLVRAQGIKRVPFNPCGCAVQTLDSNMADSVEHVRHAQDAAHLDFAWAFVRTVSERIPDNLRDVDQKCGVNTFQFNREWQDAVNARDFGRLVEASAAIRLEVCGQEFPVEGLQIGVADIERMAAETAKEEAEREAGR